MSNLSEFQLKAILKSTEELVTQARLKDIAKEHQSIGSILDDRCLYALEEPKKRDRTQSKLEIEKRLHSRRGGRGESDIKAKADQALESFKDKGVNVEMLIGNYSIEQAIWKEKSSQMAYSQKRKYQYPELQKFKDSMTGIQRNIFKEKISEAIIHLSDKYRAECKVLKIDMDLNGIFHPEANAHRVHCIYLMKLHKGIRSDTIEDPILRRLLAEKNEIARTIQEDEDRKERLVQMIENANGGPIKPQDLAAAVEKPKSPQQLALRNTSSPSNKQRLTSMASLTGGKDGPLQIDTGGPKRLNKSTSQPTVQNKHQQRTLAPLKSKSSKDLLSHTQGSENHNKSRGSMAEKSSPNKRNSTQSEEDDQQSVAAAGAGLSRAKSPGLNDKLFKKMKRDRLGATDPRSVSFSLSTEFHSVVCVQCDV